MESETMMSDQELRKSIEAVAKENNADVFVYAGPLDEEPVRTFINQCPNEVGHPNAVLYLTTYGGTAGEAYRITRHLQDRYSNGEVTLVVDSMCKSAGTLIAVGVHTIAMSDRGELGPIDIQVGQPDEVFGFQSGLVAEQALATLQEQSFTYFELGFVKLTGRSGGRITTRTAAELASSLAGTLFGQMYAQLDPMRLGENHRLMLVSREYATRLANVSKTASVSIERLISAYPSHDFVIDRKEATELFPKVRRLSQSETRLASHLEAVAQLGLLNESPTVGPLTPDATEIHTKLATNEEEAESDDETEGHNTGGGQEEAV